MKQVKLFCDICGKEFPPQEYSFLTGQVIRIDKDLKPQLGTFEGHYCGECTHDLLGYIENKINEPKPNGELKKDAEDTSKK